MSKWIRKLLGGKDPWAEQRTVILTTRDGHKQKSIIIEGLSGYVTVGIAVDPQEDEAFEQFTVLREMGGVDPDGDIVAWHPHRGWSGYEKELEELGWDFTKKNWA